VTQRLRVRYAKRGRLRFTSHRDISRAVERAVRRAGIPVAYSAGFTPHPKISYAGAAATGVASEAEYLEIGLTDARDPAWVRTALDDALPDGLDIVDVVVARAGTSIADRLEASEWRVRLDGVAPGAAAEATEAFLAAAEVEVERLTKKGLRRFDARSAVCACEVWDCEPDRRGTGETAVPCVILRMVVRHTIPAVRPDDVLAGLRQKADFAPPSPPMVTRLAQGPLNAETGELEDPLDLDRETEPPGDEATAGAGLTDVPVGTVGAGVVSAQP
jgi:radical SAM-linked protein